MFWAFFEMSLLRTLEPHVGHTNFPDFYTLSQIIIYSCDKRRLAAVVIPKSRSHVQNQTQKSRDEAPFPDLEIRKNGIQGTSNATAPFWPTTKGEYI